jgi:hypothetical protein
MEYTDDTDDDDQNFQQEEDPQLAELYSHLEGAAQDIALALKADTVQIIITRHDTKTGQSECFAAGRGNVYARIESARTFLRNKTND